MPVRCNECGAEGFRLIIINKNVPVDPERSLKFPQFCIYCGANDFTLIGHPCNYEYRKEFCGAFPIYCDPLGTNKDTEYGSTKCRELRNTHPRTHKKFIRACDFPAERNG